MARRIYKYNFDIGGPQPIEMRHQAKLLHVAMQDAAICLWAEVETSFVGVIRHFQVIGTGHDMPEGAVYIGTAHQPPFVWHLVEIPTPSTL